MEEEKFYCPNCEWEVTYGDPQCYNCNEKLEWDDVEITKKEEKPKEVEYIEEPKKEKRIVTKYVMKNKHMNYFLEFLNGIIIHGLFMACYYLYLPE